MARTAYTRGLHELGGGLYAYLLPDGGWGLSNAGIVLDGADALFVDTLTDRPSIEEMLAAFRDVAPAGARVRTVVNTHSDPDHTMGNAYFPDSEIVASRAAQAEVEARRRNPLAPRLQEAAARGHDGPTFYHEIMRAIPLDRAGLAAVPPNRTFSGTLEVAVGATAVQLIELGSAHSGGDVIAYVPHSRTVFTGDLLFSNGHPLLGERSSVDGWLRACEAILALDVETVVPGHGPLADRRHVRATRDYFIYVKTEARRFFDAGVPVDEAIAGISLAAYAQWGCPERIAANVARVYDEFAGTAALSDLEAFALMYRYIRAHAAPAMFEPE